MAKLRRLLVVLATLLALAPAHAQAAGVVNYLQTTADLADLATYAFTAQNIGTPAADRCVGVAIESRKAAAMSITITSVTIGGNAATIIIQDQASSTSTNVVGIAELLVTTGTAADIGLVFSQTMNRAQVTVYEKTGAACGTASDTDVSKGILAPSVALDVPAGGVAISTCATASGGTARTATWTGLTERYEVGNVDGAMATSGASAAFATTQTGLTMTCAWSGSATVAETVAVFASWASSGGGGGAPPPAPVGTFQLLDVGR